MDKFTASNGLWVYIGYGGAICVNGSTLYDTLDSDHTQAMREFFQHERDQELGLWRWPENPDYVVYPKVAGELVTVINETDASKSDVSKGPRDHWTNPTGREKVFEDAADAYFDAHPEPKPWHDAKPGEVWVLTVNGEEYAWSIDTTYSDRFVYAGGDFNVPRDHPSITAGRCIWPEVSDEL